MESGDGKHLDCEGTLGTGFWWRAPAGGAVVLRPWMRTVEASLARLKEAAER